MIFQVTNGMYLKLYNINNPMQQHKKKNLKLLHNYEPLLIQNILKDSPPTKLFLTNFNNLKN